MNPNPSRHDGMIILGGRGASMYMSGRVYHLVYNCIGNRRRVTAWDAQRIPWSTVNRVTVVERDANQLPTLIGMHVASFFRFQHHLYYSHSVYLSLSTRNATVRRILAERRARKEAMATPFAMGMHPRLGASSVVQCLHEDALRVVIAQL